MELMSQLIVEICILVFYT